MTAPDRIWVDGDGTARDFNRAFGDWPGYVRDDLYASLLADKERLERERDAQGDILARHLLARAESAEARVRSLEEALRVYAEGVWTTTTNGQAYVEYGGVLHQGQIARAALSTPREETTP